MNVIDFIAMLCINSCSTVALLSHGPCRKVSSTWIKLSSNPTLNLVPFTCNDHLYSDNHSADKINLKLN